MATSSCCEGCSMRTNKTGMKFAIAPIDWSNDDMPELGSQYSFSQIIEEMVQAGFHGSEVGHSYPTDASILMEQLKPYRFSIASQWFSAFLTTRPYEETLSAFKKQVAFLKSLGSQIIVVSEQGGSIQGQMDTPIFGEKRPVLDESGWERLATGLNGLGEYALENGLRVAYHHHMGTCVQTREEIDVLMSKCDPRSVFLLCDTGHITYAGGDPVALIREYASRVVHVHLKDIRPAMLEQVKKEKLSFLQSVKLGAFTVPGDGCVDFAAVFRELLKHNYSGWLVVEAEQDPAKANPLLFAKMARAYIKGIFAGLGVTHFDDLEE